MSAPPKRRKTDRLTSPAIGAAKAIVVLLILVWSLYGNASSFDETELRVIRDVSIAIVVGGGGFELLKRWMDRHYGQQDAGRRD